MSEETAKRYQKIKQRLTLFGIPWTIAILCLFSFSPLAHSIGSKIGDGNPWLTTGLYFFYFSISLFVLDLPLSVYSSYWIEKRFGLSNQNLFQWTREFLKRSILSFFIALLLIEGLYGLIRSFPQSWWLWAWVGYMLFSYLLGKLFPVLILPLFYQYGEVARPELKDRIIRLAARHGMPVNRIYSLNLSKTTKKANAAFMGMGKTKRVVLSDTLLVNFTDDEIESVMAHELGHFKHKDIWRQFAVGATISLLGFLLVYLTAGPWSRLIGYGGIEDLSAMPFLMLILYGFSLIIMPLQNLFSRYLERQADRFALGEVPTSWFIDCMKKLATINLADPDPDPLYEWFFYSHPAIRKRIQMAESLSVAGKPHA